MAKNVKGRGSGRNLLVLQSNLDEIVKFGHELKATYMAEEDLMVKRIKALRLELQRKKRTSDEYIKKPPAKKDVIYSCYNAGKPYFKDINFNQPPPNEDTRIMKQCDMYDFSTVMSVSGWNYGDTSNLQRVLLKVAQRKEKERLYSQIQLLSRIKAQEGSGRMIQAKKCEILAKIGNLEYTQLIDLDPSSYENFDWDEVALELNRHDRRHSAREYKAIWKLLLHPSVKMDKWSASEHLELQRLAREYNMQNWNAIAEELNINRTGYQCFVYYRTNMDHASSGRKWTMDEMDRLRDIIIAQREDSHIPWGKVAALMPNRTKVQCYNKYYRMMEERKGRFTEEEDAVILNYVNVFDANYKNMVNFMYGRSSLQCRNRHYLLKRPGPSATWTEEDDKKLLLAIANSNGPRTFAVACKHFGSGKERTHLRSRYHTLKRWIKKHPNSPTRNAPRRAPRRLAHGEPTTNLITALKNLQRKVNKLSDDHVPEERKPRTNRLCRDSSDNYINSTLWTQITGLQMKLVLQENISKDTMQVRFLDTVRTLSIQNIVCPRPLATDVYHLNLVLCILNTTIAEKERFQQSEYGQGFLELEMMKQDSIQGLNIRSYSRKGLSDPEPELRPDLYNGSIAGRRKYLVPPVLGTVTGSRVMLGHVHRQLQEKNTHTNTPEPFDLKRALRRKPMARKVIAELRERFNDLFLWPYELSNNSPSYSKIEQQFKKKRANVPARRQLGIPMPDVPMVTIPTMLLKRTRIRARPSLTNPQVLPIDLDEKDIKKSIKVSKISVTNEFEPEADFNAGDIRSVSKISDEPAQVYNI